MKSKSPACSWPLIGVALTAVALRPPKALVRVYLAVEQALAVFLGVLLAAAGIGGLLAMPAPRRAASRITPSNLTNRTSDPQRSVLCNLPRTVRYKLLDPRAKAPLYATPGAAAADLCALLDEPLTIAPMQRVLVPTGLAIELPGPDCVALVYARSGLSIKHGLCMATA